MLLACRADTELRMHGDPTNLTALEIAERRKPLRNELLQLDNTSDTKCAVALPSSKLQQLVGTFSEA